MLGPRKTLLTTRLAKCDSVLVLAGNSSCSTSFKARDWQSTRSDEFVRSCFVTKPEQRGHLPAARAVRRWQHTLTLPPLSDCLHRHELLRSLHEYCITRRDGFCVFTDALSEYMRRHGLFGAFTLTDSAESLLRLAPTLEDAHLCRFDTVAHRCEAFDSTLDDGKASNRNELRRRMALQRPIRSSHDQLKCDTCGARLQAQWLTTRQRMDAAHRDAGIKDSEVERMRRGSDTLGSVFSSTLIKHASKYGRNLAIIDLGGDFAEVVHRLQSSWVQQHPNHVPMYLRFAPNRAFDESASRPTAPFLQEVQPGSDEFVITVPWTHAAITKELCQVLALAAVPPLKTA
ncbi:MAG: hypothetical protein MHM6MM_004844 [Cercozoa sp. M6MM]